MARRVPTGWPLGGEVPWAFNEAQVGPRRIGHSKAYLSIILKQIMVSVGYRYEICK